MPIFEQMLSSSRRALVALGFSQFSTKSSIDLTA